MKRPEGPARAPTSTAAPCLGVECGATRSVALFGNSRRAKRAEFGPANLQLLDQRALVAHFGLIRDFHLPNLPAAIAVGMAGARTESDRKRICLAAAAVWPSIPCYATNDLETALAAARNDATGANQTSVAQVLVLSGTGSCCFGQQASGKTAKIGGWGHMLGDKGSGYEIGLRALKAVVYYFDRDGLWPKLGQRILTVLQLKEPNELIAWVQRAAKPEIAALTREVFRANDRGDAIARDLLAAAAHGLAADAVACARRLANPRQPVRFVYAGSVLLKHPRFQKTITREIKRHWPAAISAPLQAESAIGALLLAEKHGETNAVATRARPILKPAPKAFAPAKPLPLTELRNPRSLNLDRLPVEKAVDLMLSEEGQVASAIRSERKKIAQVIRWISRAFKTGGRLFYVGAGTSGRLGVLDASECPPTFRTPPEMVQAIMAGGPGAVWRAVEGAEDDALAGAAAIQEHQIRRRDVVVGIAASGRTPFVLGALREAGKRHARTVLLCFSRNSNPDPPPDLVIAPLTGPEILTGSTRLKAGTATKLILNMFTTLAMVQIGKVTGNLMTDLNPTNVKLRDRAIRIVQELSASSPEAARAALEQSGWRIRPALKKLQPHSPRRKSSN